jgi:hypothetical protein
MHMVRKGLKRYHDNPVGDLLEMMPWDNLLNQDLHMLVEARLALTTNLEEDRKKKFSMSTPLRGAHAYHRILDPTTGNVPSSQQIVKDVEKVFKSMIMIQTAKGTVVQGLGNWKGAGRQHNQGGQ